jgi:hypothetical protein
MKFEGARARNFVGQIFFIVPNLYPVHLLVIPMHICTSHSLFSHSYVVNEWLNRHCNVQIDIGITADELGISVFWVSGGCIKKLGQNLDFPCTWSCWLREILTVKYWSSFDHFEALLVSFTNIYPWLRLEKIWSNWLVPQNAYHCTGHKNSSYYTVQMAKGNFYTAITCRPSAWSGLTYNEWSDWYDNRTTKTLSELTSRYPDIAYGDPA